MPTTSASLPRPLLPLIALMLLLNGCISRSSEHEVAGWWYDVCPDDGLAFADGTTSRSDDRNLCIRYGRCTTGRNNGGARSSASVNRSGSAPAIAARR